MKRFLVALAVIAAPLFAQSAWADTLTFSCPNGADTNCDFTLTLDSLTTEADGTQTAVISLTIDTAATPANDVIRAVAIKVVSSDTDINSFALTSAPGGAGNWTTTMNVLNANGCTGSSNPGEICSVDSDLAPLDGTSYTWTWTINVDAGELFLDTLQASVKAQYCVAGTTCDSTNFLGLTSQGITLQQGGEGGFGGTGGEAGFGGTGGTVPAPAAVLLLGVGLVGVAVGQHLSRRRR